MMPLSSRDLHTAWSLLERLTWEMDQEHLAALGGLGLERRRLWLTREPTGAWLYERIDSDETLVSLGPEAVWAAGATSLDAWLGARSALASPADVDVLPQGAPALDVRFHATARPATRTPGVEILLRPLETEPAS